MAEKKNNKFGVVFGAFAVALTVFVTLRMTIPTDTNAVIENTIEELDFEVVYSSNSLTDELRVEIQDFNQKLDEYYVMTWSENQYISHFGYLTSQITGVEVTISDIYEYFQTEVPENLLNAEIYFVKPKTLKPYLKDGILDEDLEILSVYSAIPLEEGGVFISSRYDEGAIITFEAYKDFAMNNNPMYGDIVSLNYTQEDYQNILKAVAEKDEYMENGNVKHMTTNGKYASVVVGSPQNPANIRQFGLMINSDGNWEVIIENLEQVDQVIFTNYAYTDFDLGLLPSYNLQYMSFSSNVDELLYQLSDDGVISDSDVANYACMSGNFAYIEFENGKKILKHSENVYDVKDAIEAIELMFTLDYNPPFVIVKF